MQFRIAHLLMVITCISAIMAIQNVEIFRQIVTVFWTLLAAWMVGSVAARSRWSWNWQLGALAGLAVTVAWYLILMLTWPRFFNLKVMGLLSISPTYVFWREVSFFALFTPLVGAAVGGWAVVANHPELSSRFKIPVTFSQAVLAGVVVFRLLTLVGDYIPDWESLSLFAVLVFVIHTFNWLPRLNRSASHLRIAGPSEAESLPGDFSDSVHSGTA